jgi:hypothetical protein
MCVFLSLMMYSYICIYVTKCLKSSVTVIMNIKSGVSDISRTRWWCSTQPSLSVQCTLVIGLSELGVDLAIRYILATRHLELASSLIYYTHYCYYLVDC